MRDFGLTNAAPYASAPAVGAAGDTYWNTAGKVLYVSDGTSWVPVPAGGAASGDLAGTYPGPTLAAGPLALSAYANARRTTAQVIPTGALTTVVFDSLAGNSGGLWNAGAPDRLTVQRAGFYLLGAGAEFAAGGAGGRRHFRLAIDGTSWATYEQAPGTAGGNPAANLAIGIILAVNDYIQLIVFQDSGGNLNLVAGSGSGMWANIWASRVF